MFALRHVFDACFPGRPDETVRNVAAGGAAVAGLGILLGALLSRR